MMMKEKKKRWQRTRYLYVSLPSFSRARSLVLLKVKMSPYEAEISLADEV